MSPLDAALTLRFAKNTEHDTSKVLRLPHGTIFDMFADTCKCQKVSRLPHKTTLQPVLKPSTRRGFAASPTDTETSPESQRLETRHVGASKRAFRARHCQISHFPAFSYEFSCGLYRTSTSTFRARHPSICITCHKMPRMPRNLHLVTT